MKQYLLAVHMVEGEPAPSEAEVCAAWTARPGQRLPTTPPLP